MLMFFFDGLRSFTAEMKSIFEEVSFLFLILEGFCRVPKRLVSLLIG